MEKITDIFKEFKDRLSNPFVFSYLVAWLIWNWQLPVALLFYSNEDFTSYGYSGFIPYAEDYLKSNHHYYWPLIIALLYSFAFPLFRNLVLMAQSFFKSQSSRWNDKVAKGGVVAIEKYVAMREAYKDRQIKLAEIIKEESSLQERFTELERQKNELDSELRSITNKLEVESADNILFLDELNQLKKERDAFRSKEDYLNKEIKLFKEEVLKLHRSKSPHFINGNWLLKYNNGTMIYESYEISITDYVMFYRGMTSEHSHHEVILIFNIDTQSGKMTFLSAWQDNGFVDKSKTYLFDLVPIPEVDNQWAGTIYGDKTLQITFTRISS